VVSAGLRRSIEGVLQSEQVRLSAMDAKQWKAMIRLVLQQHGVKVPDSFK
jgi:hypothetical protein